MQKLRVKTSHEYDIVIEKDFGHLGSQIKSVYNGQKILIITDSNVSPLYLQTVKAQLVDFNVYTYTITAGENSKNTQNYFDVCEYLAANTFSRKDAVLALGGGVVGDLSGFVAATYMRGITFIQCPTTLLSAVDSSVGGKTAVNLKQGKNLLGAFYQPSLVYIPLCSFSTLPKAEISNGMGEIIKYAFLSKTVNRQMIERLDYEQIILACLKIKADVVSQDEFEGGVRALLNLGHTVGHAIETLSDYTLPHGVCVAKGINKIIRASKNFYHLSNQKVDEFYSLLSVYPFELDVAFDDQEIIQKITNDKKANGDSVNVVLISDIGDVRIQNMKITQFKELL